MPTHVLLREIAAGYGFGVGFAAVGSVGLYLFFGELVEGGGLPGVAFAFLGYVLGSVMGVVWMGEAYGAPGNTVLGAVPAVVAAAVWLWPPPRPHRGLDPVLVLKLGPLLLLPVLVALCYNASVIVG